MQLYIVGLGEDITESELSRLFSKIGSVKSVAIIKDIYSGKSRGIAVVAMSTGEEVEEAVKQLNGTKLGSRKIAVSQMPETLPGEMEFREWLHENAFEVLGEVGIQDGQTVLDYGCGPGVFTIPCARIVGDKGRVYALDIRAHELERVNEKARNEGLSNIETILADSSRLATGLSDRSMDVILVYDVMHAISEKMGLLEELHRVLKKDGLLSIFPMHLGTDKMLDIMDECGLFYLKNRNGPPGYKTASEILNFIKK